tara:strand:- start:61 stop:612 length:552 start_codon:yes stop_codon:yes gene_type:complete
MGAPKIVSQIPDLQLKWSKSYPDRSIRDFLISIKGFTPRQYKRILEKAPKGEWAYRREEVQNRIAVESLEAHVEEAKKVNERFMKTAEVAVAIATKQMVDDSIDPKGLLNAISSVEKAQKVYCEALGLNKAWTPPAPESKPEVPIIKGASASYADKLSYDDIVEFIEYRREMKVRRSSTTTDN